MGSVITIRQVSQSMSTPEPERKSMAADPVSGRQIRAARALLAWGQATLAERSGVSLKTIRRAEGRDGLPPLRRGNMAKLRQAFEEGGIVFVFGDGVRLPADGGVQ